MNNIITDTDSYKASHFLQFPPGTTGMYSYLESRGGKYERTVWFGLQMILKKYLTQKITEDMVKEAFTFFTKHGVPFNLAGWLRIATDLDGKLPVKIHAAEEGMVIPTNNVLMTVESTDPETFWIVSWLETMLMRVWYPTTVATSSWHIKQLIKRYLEETSNDLSELPFKLHDFGSRGVSSRESAELGGAAHLVNFQGSDTVAGVIAANTYYKHEMSAFSIPASEHSTITSWGREGEADAYENMLTHFARPGSVVAVVSDSYNLYNAISNLWGGCLKEKVKQSGATVVIRPDSGDPAQVVLNCLQLLAEKFGTHYNSKAYKVLNHVRVIQGDGVNTESIRNIFETAKTHGFSASNINLGMGGALLQQVNRDTQRFAYKCSEITRNGQRIPVCKNPATDPSKASKAGRLDLIVTPKGEYATVTGENYLSRLKLVYDRGEIVREYDLDTVRKNSEFIYP